MTDALTTRIDALPPIARQDLLDDLASGSTPDADLMTALDMTLDVHERTGLDGEELYAAVQKQIAKRYGVPNWVLTLMAKVGA